MHTGILKTCRDGELSRWDWQRRKVRLRTVFARRDDFCAGRAWWVRFGGQVTYA